MIAFTEIITFLFGICLLGGFMVCFLVSVCVCLELYVFSVNPHLVGEKF